MDEIKQIKRPKPSDGEEELYQMQEEFLKSRQAPSAKVINLRADNKKQFTTTNEKTEPRPIVKFRSKFAEQKAQKKLSTSQTSGDGAGGSVLNPAVVPADCLADPVKELPDNINEIPPEPPAIILGDIVEKKPTKIDDKNYCKFVKPVPSESGFPPVFIVKHNQPVDKNKSLFSQSLVSSKISPENLKIKEKMVENVKQETSVFHNEQLSSEIDRENREKLNRMTEEEILEEKKSVESLLTPEMIKFIKERKKNLNKKIIQEEIKMETDEETINHSVDKKTLEDVEMEEEETPMNDPPEEVVELVEAASEKGWIHMDEVEQVKLEWMADLPPDKPSDQLPEEPYNARFDFSGTLLPFKDETIVINSGLHHHGEEPDRPGYSLQELLQLSRSSSQQQRCTALTTLANIINKSKKGWYDKVLDPAPLFALSSKNILFLLRVSIDDSSVAVVTSGLQALCSFLYNEADEICLDRLFGWKYEDGLWTIPELTPPKNDVDNFDELKDDEYAQLDVVAAAVRSDLVLRIRFILDELQPPAVGVTSSLEILTRLARHSRKTALNIACTPRLLEIIVKNFIPLTTNRLMIKNEAINSYGTPQIAAVRLCRVLIEYAGRPVADRLYNLEIMKSLVSYLTSETGEAGLRLIIEVLRLWLLIVNSGVARDSVGGARLMLGTKLQLLLANQSVEGSSELSCEYAAALVVLACREEVLKPTVNTLLNKWSTQLATTTSPIWCNTKLVALTLSALGETSSFNTNWIFNENIFLKLSESSNILGKYPPAKERDPSALPSLGVLLESGKIQPILSLQSCQLFLSTVLNVFYKKSMISEIEKVISNPSVVMYLEKLSKNEWTMTSNWFTRIELFLITGLIRASTKIDLNKSTRDIVLNIAVKLISSLPGDAPDAIKYILKYVFSNEKLAVQRLSNDLNALKIGGNSREDSLELPENISSIYEVYVSFGNWSDAGMPRDWPYLPIVAAYTRQRNKINWDENDTMKIVILLSLELAMPELVQNLSPSLRFSRLILAYLCDTIHLNENVSVLLKKTMKLFLNKYHSCLNFSIDVPGVSSFTDIFVSLCECFCANSYGDDGFAAVLMVPIAQRHDTHYRKLLWSEHAGALRYLKLGNDKLLVPLEEYLYPVENDSSLVEAYITALVRKTVQKNINPLMYNIALHHSAMFLKGQSKLATNMRSKIRGIQDATLADALLNYSTT